MPSVVIGVGTEFPMIFVKIYCPWFRKVVRKYKTLVNKLKVETKWYVFISLWKMFINLNSDRGLVTQRGLCSFCLFVCLVLHGIHYQEHAILKSFHLLLCRTLIVHVGNQTKICLQGHFLSFITEFIPLCRKKITIMPHRLFF